MLFVRARVVHAVGGIVILTGAGAASAQFSGPSPYVQFPDSPFYAAYAASQFQYFHVENFEDGALNTPGVASSGGAVAAPGNATDSVDVDDGVIDGSGLGGHSYEFFTTALTFTFNAGVLGGLPTHAGIVWTDVGGSGQDAVSFEAFDQVGNSLGVIGPAALGDGNVLGGTAEDRFWGVANLGGISSIVLHVNFPDTEVDHLQYGRFVPSPGSAAALALAGVVRAGGRRRRR
jgi:hypothetical protein